jgi:hypothetical protein
MHEGNGHLAAEGREGRAHHREQPDRVLAHRRVDREIDWNDGGHFFFA